MKEIIYKIKELEKLGFYKLADKLDSELIKIAQMPPNLLPPNLLPPVNSAPLNDFELAQFRNMLKSDSANDTNVLSPGLQNNQNQSTIEKRLNDLLGKYVALEKRSKNTMDKFPPIISTNEDQNSDIDTNTQDIMNLKTQLGNTQTEEPEEPTV